MIHTLALILLFKSLKLSLNNDNGDYNELAIAFHEGASIDYDQQFDGKKMKGNWNMSFYTTDDLNDYAVQAFQPLHEMGAHSVNIGFDARYVGNYTLEVRDIKRFTEATSIILEDRYTGEMYDLRSFDGLSFSVTEPGRYKDRFLVHFLYGQTITPVNQPNVDPSSEVNTSIQNKEQSVPKIYAYQNAVYVNLNSSDNEIATVQIFDMLGQQIENRILENGNLNKINLQVEQGVYLVHVQYGTKVYTEKVEIR